MNTSSTSNNQPNGGAGLSSPMPTSDTPGQTTVFAPSVAVTTSSPQATTGAFIDDVPAETIGVVPRPMGSGTDSNPRTGSYETFFDEFVRINNVSWPSSSGVGTQLYNLDVVAALLAIPSVARKLTNFWRATWDAIEVKIVVNSSKTSFGHAVVHALPQGYETYGDGVGTFLSGALAPQAYDTLPTIYQAFSGIHGDLSPATSQPIVLKLPWISPLDALALDTVTNTGPLGGGPQTQWRLLIQVVAALGNSTNMAAATNATITTYGRFVNFRLSTPVAYQSGHGKKKQGTVGRVAATVGSISGALKGVPVVGEVAAGVELLSGAVGAVADFFGFTRETDHQPVGKSQLHPLPGLPHADGLDTSVPLSILADNKVSIDPGFGGDDGMDIEAFGDLFRRKSLIGLYTWTCATGVNSNIIVRNVGPSQSAAIVGTSMYLPPFAYVASQFGHWRGPIFYELKIYASPQHSGRLQIAYYPTTQLPVDPSADPTNVSYNAIIDVQGETSVTFRIGWTRPRPFIETGDAAAWTVSPNAATCNGFFAVRVVNELTAPDTTANVTLELYAFTDETFQLANPRVTPTTFVLQSGPMDLVPSGGDDVSAVCMGERVSSVRTLVQRPTPWTLWLPFFDTDVASTRPRLWAWVTQFFPTTPHETDTGVHDPFEFTQVDVDARPLFPHPLKWYSHLFLGWRGSWRYKVIVIPSDSSNSMPLNTGTSNTWSIRTVLPQHYSKVLTGQSFSPYFTQYGPVSAVTAAWKFISEPGSNAPNGHHYQDVASLGNAIEFTVPYYSPRRFNLCRVNPKGDDGTNQGGDQDPGAALCALVRTNANAVGDALDGPAGIVFASAGDDFSFQRFRFVPTIIVTP